MPEAPRAGPIDAAEFRRLLGTFPTGVAIITTRTAGGVPVGLTCNSFSSVSLEPPLVLFSLRKASSSLEAFRAAPSFAINILSQEQDALSARFASSKITDKFEGIAWSAGSRGLPLIDDCLASFECRVYASHEAGDHVIFIGEVESMRGGETNEALVFYKGAYMMLAQSLRAMVMQGRMDVTALDEANLTVYGGLLQLAAARATEADLDAIDRAIDDIERHVRDEELPVRAEAAVRFFASIADAAHSEALGLVAQTLTTLLRHRMVYLHPIRMRQDLIPLRREIVAHLRQRNPDAAVAAMNDFIRRLREPA